MYLGANLNWTYSGFKRKPFSSSHLLRASFATNTLGASVRYRGLFPETIGSLDQTIEVLGRSPTFTRRFYGITNTFVDPSVLGREFFEVRQSELGLEYGVEKRLSDDAVRFGLKGLTHMIDIESVSYTHLTLPTKRIV